MPVSPSSYSPTLLRPYSVTFDDTQSFLDHRQTVTRVAALLSASQIAASKQPLAHRPIWADPRPELRLRPFGEAAFVAILAGQKIVDVHPLPQAHIGSPRGGRSGRAWR